MNYQWQIYSNTKVGFEFEFFSTLPEKDLKSKLSDFLNKKITFGVKKRGFKDSKITYHSGVTPTEDMFKIEKDFSGGPSMYELITGPINYWEAKTVLIKCLEFIRERGSTNDRSSLHINISFNKEFLRVDDLNILKFCLNFDSLEEDIYHLFPMRKNNIYCESITRIYPHWDYFTTYRDDLINVGNAKTILPTDSKYYGVNFEKIKEGYLEFRYIGGKDYEKKPNRIASLLEKFTLYLADSITNKNFDTKDSIKYTQKVKKILPKLEGFRDFDSFRIKFPEIYIFVDLQNNLEKVKIYFNTMKKDLFELVVLADLKEASINYDTDLSVFQIKDASLNKNKTLRGFQFFNCELQGTYEQCEFFNCRLKNSLINMCSLSHRVEIEDSKIWDCDIESTVDIKNCFIKNITKEVSGNIEDSIIVGDKSILSKIANVDKKTLFVDNDGKKSKK